MARSRTLMQVSVLVSWLALFALGAEPGPAAGNLRTVPISIEQLDGDIWVRAVNVPTLELLDAIIKAGDLKVQEPEGFRTGLRTYATYVEDGRFGKKDAAKALWSVCVRSGVQCNRQKDGSIKLGKGWGFIWEKTPPEAFLARFKTEVAPVRPLEGGVDTGHVILHGHYIPPPYKFEVTDRKPWQCTIRLNAVVVATSGFVPISFRKPVKLPPSGIFKSRSDAMFYFFQNYIAWEKKLGRKAALDKAKAFFKGPPYNCSKVVIHERASEMEIEYRNERGRRDRELVDIPNEEKLKKLDPDNYTKRAITIFEKGYMKDLREGKLLVFSHYGGKRVLGKERAEAVLRALTEALQTDAPLLRKDRAVLDLLHGDSASDVNHRRELSWEILANFRLTEEQRRRISQPEE